MTVKRLSLKKKPLSYNRTSWSCIYIGSACSFIQSIQFSVFASSLWPFLKKLDNDVAEDFMARIVSLYSLGQCLAAPALGYWSNRIDQLRLPLLVGFVFMLAGNLLYFVTSLLPLGYKYAILAARIITGVGTGNSSLVRTLASTSSTKTDRAKALAYINGASSLGTVLGPAFQLIFSPLGNSGLQIGSNFSLNIYTAPALFAVLMNVAGIFLLIIFYKERITVEEIDEECASTDIIEFSAVNWVTVFLAIATRFICLLMASNLETLTGPYSMLMFSFTKEESITWNALVHGVRGTICVLVSVVFLAFNTEKWISSRFGSLLGICGFALFFLLTFPWSFLPITVQHTSGLSDVGCNIDRYSWCLNLKTLPPWAYYGLVSLVYEVSFNIANILLSTLLSFALGTRKQGTLQGVYQMAGSIGRMIGPLMFSYSYIWNGPIASNSLSIGILFATIIIWLVLYRRINRF